MSSTRLKTGTDGDESYSSNNEPFGPGYGDSGGEEFRYTGKREDTTGLYYYGARYYHPETGRLLKKLQLQLFILDSLKSGWSMLKLDFLEPVFTLLHVKFYILCHPVDTGARWGEK